MHITEITHLAPELRAVKVITDQGERLVPLSDDPFGIYQRFVAPAIEAGIPVKPYEPPVIPPSDLSATGRQLIAAARALATQEAFPDDLVAQLLTMKKSNLELDASWSPDGPMRRDSAEMKIGAQMIDDALGEGQGAALLDALFMTANQVNA